jgi:hypothetical protein
MNIALFIAHPAIKHKIPARIYGSIAIVFGILFIVRLDSSVNQLA